MKKISTKVLISAIVSTLVLSIVIGGISIYEQNVLVNSLIKELDSTINNDFDVVISSAVDAMTTELDAINTQIISGELSEADGKKLAADLIRTSFYYGDGYFWVDTLEG